jgi:hypothetical protein
MKTYEVHFRDASTAILNAGELHLSSLFLMLKAENEDKTSSIVVFPIQNILWWVAKEKAI